MNNETFSNSNIGLCQTTFLLRARFWGSWIWRPNSQSRENGIELIRFQFLDKQSQTLGSSNACTPVRSKYVPDTLKNLIESTRDFFHNNTPAKISLTGVRLVLPTGSPFSCEVYKALSKTKSVISYAELAKNAGHPKAIRATASLVGKNNITLYRPCHRIITSSGRLGKFSAPGGALLKLEILLRERGLWSAEEQRNLEQLKGKAELTSFASL